MHAVSQLRCFLLTFQMTAKRWIILTLRYIDSSCRPLLCERANKQTTGAEDLILKRYIGELLSPENTPSQLSEVTRGFGVFSVAAVQLRGDEMRGDTY